MDDFRTTQEETAARTVQQMASLASEGVLTVSLMSADVRVSIGLVYFYNLQNVTYKLAMLAPG